VITAAGLCPWPPILARELTGIDPVIPELRASCAEVTDRLIRTEPDAIVVVGPAADTQVWTSSDHLDLSLFAPVRSVATSSLPPSLGLGAYLLDRANYDGRRILQAVGSTEPVNNCVALGQTFANSGDRLALLVMGDGSARRSVRAPGHLDPRAEPFDAAVERAIATSDFAALEQLDGGLAQELMVTGVAPWQVLSGAIKSITSSIDMLYADAPFGVMYFVALFTPVHSGHYA
jgi:hypothetical protein